MTFQDLNLHRNILQVLEEEKYITPTPIQQQAIPIILEENDLVGCAQTGTGKNGRIRHSNFKLFTSNCRFKKQKKSN